MYVVGVVEEIVVDFVVGGVVVCCGYVGLYVGGYWFYV